MTSRRAFLAGLGTIGATTLAGCSNLPFGDSDDEEPTDVSLPPDAVEPVAWPASPFPIAVPAEFADAHRDRAEELLADVPTEPSIPNAAVADKLRSDRNRAADRLDEAVDHPWPIDELSRWRRRRNAAATVRGAYRAATGEDDAESVTDRRRSIRGAVGTFLADQEYAASTPIDAVLVYRPVEDLLSTCRRRARPDPAYPGDPIARPFRAGDAVGRIETAEATLADARRLREAYLAEQPAPSAQWDVLIDASKRLRIAVGRSRSTVRDVIAADEPPFDADLDGTAGRSLFHVARRQVERMADDFGQYRTDGAYATAVLTAGRTLAAIEALQATIDGLRDDAYLDPVTVESVTRTADRARDAIAAIDASADQRVATQVVRPALEIYDYVPDRIQEGYADAARIQGELAWAELYARAVPAATGFVLARLERPDE